MVGRSWDDMNDSSGLHNILVWCWRENENKNTWQQRIKMFMSQILNNDVLKSTGVGTHLSVKKTLTTPNDVSSPDRRIACLILLL